MSPKMLAGSTSRIHTQNRFAKGVTADLQLVSEQAKMPRLADGNIQKLIESLGGSPHMKFPESETARKYRASDCKSGYEFSMAKKSFWHYSELNFFKQPTESTNGHRSAKITQMPLPNKQFGAGDGQQWSNNLRSSISNQTHKQKTRVKTTREQQYQSANASPTTSPKHEPL